jgi:hypothetical protein
MRKRISKRKTVETQVNTRLDRVVEAMLALRPKARANSAPGAYTRPFGAGK